MLKEWILSQYTYVLPCFSVTYDNTVILHLNAT